MSVKKVTKRSVKKEIIPHGTKLSGKPGEGALISFSEVEATLAHFSQPGAFVSFVGTKERGRQQWQDVGPWQSVNTYKSRYRLLGTLISERR